MKTPPKIFRKINTAIPLACHPRVLIALNRLCNRDTVRSRDMARLVVMDPALTIKIMRVRADEGSAVPAMEAVDRNLSRLGPAAVKSAALFCLSNPLSNPRFLNTDADFNRFWFHSLRCATTARSVSAHLFPEWTDEAYIAGLLHDVGKLLLWSNFKKDYEPLFKKSMHGDSALPAENDAIGTNHCEAGWHLVRNLKAHPFVGDSILYHHVTPESAADALPLVKIIFIANVLCYEGNIADHSEMARTLGLDLASDRIADILADAEENVAARLKELNLTVEEVLSSFSPRPRELDDTVFSILEEFRGLAAGQLVIEPAFSCVESGAVQEKLLQSFKILFDIGTAFLLCYDPSRDSLHTTSMKTDTEEEILYLSELPVAGGRNLPAQVLTHRCILDSFGYLTNELITIADEQLVRLLKTQGMLCLPLVCSDRRVGVICAGIDELQFPLLWEQQELLNSFAARAAALLDRTRVADVQPPYVKETGRQFDEQAVRRVAHEVNNPLGIVKNYLNLLADNPSVKDEVDLIRQEIERIPDIIAQLSKTRYKDSAADESVDINAIIEDLSKIMIPPGRQAPITLTFDPDRNLPPFLGKKSHLEQVLINLLKNSIEAMPKGGRIHISTAYEAKETDVSGGDITVLIRDDGPGIPAKKLERIFEPGVSSKGSEHEGLGLAVSKEIIVDYGGTIGCRNRKDRGTVFRITLPVSSRNP